MVLDIIARIMHTTSPLISYNLQRWFYLVVTSYPNVITLDIEEVYFVVTEND